MIVMKFGGSSVADRSQIEKVMSIIAAHRSRRPVIVCSAHKGITNELIEAAKRACRGEDPNLAVIDRQRQIAASLGCSPTLLDPLFGELRDLLRGIRLVRELSPRSLDYISSFGERMSVRCIADFFCREGLASRAFDAWDLGLITDNKFGKSRPVAEYDHRMKAAFAERVSPDVIPLITGFIGKDERGDITTLGRNGSDLTATLVAAAIDAEEVQIWSDTDGVMTADPRIVSAAKNIPTMHFDEAAELAFFGSRVLHPATLLPAVEKEIPVRVLNTNRPDHPGTVIGSDALAKHPEFTSIAYKERQAVLTIVEPRMFEQVGFLARVFTVLATHGVVIDMVATSEVSVSVTSHDIEALRSSIPDLTRFGRVSVEGSKAIVAIVGRQVRDTPGIGAKVLAAMGNAGVNVEMHTYGMQSINITLLIDETRVPQAIPALHRALFDA